MGLWIVIERIYSFDGSVSIGLGEGKGFEVAGDFIESLLQLDDLILLLEVLLLKGLLHLLQVFMEVLEIQSKDVAFLMIDLQFLTAFFLELYSFLTIGFDANFQEL